MQFTEYQESDLLRLAKRYQNAKRNYLLVNPLQAKHLAVSPHQALTMMEQLGKKLRQDYPHAKLIIGFAETATAIAMHAAMQFPEDVQFLHTTRENSEGSCLYFQEEHSHAVDQKLYLSDQLPETEQIILVDDEISTGKTLRNMILQIRRELSVDEQTKFIAGSVINRVSAENLQWMEQENIFCTSLCKLNHLDYSRQVDSVQVTAPVQIIIPEKYPYRCIIACNKLPDSRKPHTIGIYRQAYLAFAEEICAAVCSGLQDKTHLLVLGTEECMYPALILGAFLMRNGFSVKCHATTRSPIGISQDEHYPVHEGYALPSFYDPSRTTYIYNTDTSAEAVLIVTDSTADTEQAMLCLGSLFPHAEKILIKG